MASVKAFDPGDIYSPGQRNLTETVVILEVGPGKRRFIVHQDLLRAQSSYFRSALKDEWNTKRDNILRLPDDNGLAVGLYLFWLYANKAMLDFGALFTASELDREYNRLIQAYIFAEKTVDLEFADVVLESIFALTRIWTTDTKLRHIPRNNSIDIVYKGTIPSSPLRRLLVRLWICEAKSDWVSETLPPRFLADLTCQLLGGQIRKVPLPDAGCEFHNHTNGHACRLKGYDHKCRVQRLDSTPYKGKADTVPK